MKTLKHSTFIDNNCRVAEMYGLNKFFLLPKNFTECTDSVFFYFDGTKAHFCMKIVQENFL